MASPLDASRLEISPLPNPKPYPGIDSPDLAALKTATDRMVLATWTAQNGWDAPKIVPHGPLALLPSASALQYATQCFEGMKVFRGHDGKLRLFRPLFNCQRMVASARRISLPTMDPEEMLKLIRKLCAMEGPKWLPKGTAEGTALYIRPTLIGTDDSMGFKVPEEAQLCIFLLFWPTPKPAAGETKKPEGIRLLASKASSVRAWPGGTGTAKIGGNYGAALLEHEEAKKGGFNQVLWLYGPERLITEAGSTNIFVVWRTAAGTLQIVTSPLDEDKLILAGNTRRSVVALSQEMFTGPLAPESVRCEVLERKITMGEVEEAAQENRLVGVFVTGTAFWIQEVGEISVDGRSVKIQTDGSPHVSILRDRMSAIMYGKEDHEWAELVDEAEG